MYSVIDENAWPIFTSHTCLGHNDHGSFEPEADGFVFSQLLIVWSRVQPLCAKHILCIFFQLTDISIFFSRFQNFKILFTVRYTLISLPAYMHDTFLGAAAHPTAKLSQRSMIFTFFSAEYFPVVNILMTVFEVFRCSYMQYFYLWFALLADTLHLPVP